MPHHAATSATLVRDHASDFLLIGLIQNHVCIELAFALGGFGSQDVALERVTAFNLATYLSCGSASPLRYVS